MKTIAFVDLLHLYNDHHGIYALTSVLRRKDTSLFFISSRNITKAIRHLKEVRPDMVLYSSFSATIPQYITFDKIAKSAISFTSVIGGPGPTTNCSTIRESTIDAICVGEGEYAIVDFIESDGQSTGNIFRREDAFPTDFNPLVNMDDLPFPDRATVYETDTLLRDMPSKQFFSGRGCPYNCSYCFNHQFRKMFQGCGPLVRKKSVDYFIEEIKDIHKKYPLTEVVFNDDLFIVQKKWFAEFCDRYPREVGLPYTCNIRADLINEDIAAGLRDSLCRGVNWAIETGNEAMRNETLRRDMTDEQIYQAARCLKKYDIPFRTGNILGLPGETLAQMYQTVDMNINVRPYLGLANIFAPFPGSKLTLYAIEHGFYQPSDAGTVPKDYFSKSILNFNPEEKNRIYKLFCLFPLFIQWPVLFHKTGLRRSLMALPNIVLRPAYELIYTFKMARLCIPRTPLKLKFRMVLRHLKNL